MMAEAVCNERKKKNKKGTVTTPATVMKHGQVVDLILIWLLGISGKEIMILDIMGGFRWLARYPMEKNGNVLNF